MAIFAVMASEIVEQQGYHWTWELQSMTPGLTNQVIL